MIALDVSNSMMAKDIAPNRLEKAKMMLSKLVDELDNDKIGLIVFAGDAYTQLPITSDFVSAKMFLNTIILIWFRHKVQLLVGLFLLR